MDGIQDLIDPRQVDLFDAFDKLSSLGDTNDIEPPQLVVIGSQSSGKSSVLEAIARFHFPVSDKLCTRFPTKLVIRRSPEARIELSIDPGPSRPESDRNRLQQFTRSLSNTNEFEEHLKSVAVELGVSNKGLPNSAPTSDSKLKEFADDTLVVRIYGPLLPLVNLVDLPSVFTNTIQGQSETSMRKVQEMAKEHAQCKSNLILLVVNARVPFVNETGVEIIKNLLLEDPGLAGRVVGVITHPDDPSSHSESLDLLNGKLADFKLTQPWHVVRNQSQNERAIDETLEQRDKQEKDFFLHSNWKVVPESQRGIQALNLTLKEMFWTHTQAELPALMSRVRAKIKKGSIADSRRSSPLGRRKYLHDIAKKFETLTKEACQGTYRDEDCKELHKVGEDCSACKRFFGFLGDDCMDMNLLANVRSLNKAFAVAMREFGKTKEITRSANITKSQLSTHWTDPPDQESPDNEPHQRFPTPHIMRTYYTHDKVALMDEKTFEKWLAEQIPVWRGHEPQGEASEVVYSCLMEYQSKNWQQIASKHLCAVWKSVERFVKLALTATCYEDKKVFQSILEHLVTPKLEELEKKSHQTLKDLLNCHGRGKTGFYDGFVHSRPMRWHAQDLAQRLADLKAEVAVDRLGVEQSSESRPKPEKYAISDEILKIAEDVVGRMISTSFTGPMGADFIKDVVFRKVESVLSQAFQSERKTSGDKIDSIATVRKATFGLIPVELENIAAARVIEYVDAYYEMSMMAFVGYVNSLVVENGILRELPKAILTQTLVINENADLVDRVVAQPDGEAKRVQDLQILKTVLEMLKKYH
ncbi:hypothetical protein TWF192_003687 [Orbilia oligospora]|uniref:GED domain-containing protein n=1 Tax=Orbilia oligospora TaxID=2813651 RepID=A0A6G1MBW9_ORBOL|nr:hypothetical protein TWF191_002220 [Orbilia oligospora]KAF3253433.1 hypothetical protein TWF192_003687 [Orbilia oligospora]